MHNLQFTINFVKNIFKDLEKFKRIRNHVPKCNLNFLISSKKPNVSKTQGDCHMTHKFLGSCLGKV